MTPLVLGLNSNHPDSSAVLVGPQGVIAAIAEERINRLKHCAVFPREAIQEVLRIGGASIGDVTDIAIARDPKANLNAKLAFIARNPRVGLNLARVRLAQHRQAGSGSSLASQMGVSEGQLKANIHAVEHHLAHIASAFFWSPFERATGISVDGSGDFASVMIADCRGNDIKVLRRTHLPHSLGGFYTSVCGFIGFNKYGEEYKVMGLAAYGEDRYAKEFAQLCTYDKERGVRLNPEFFTTYTRVHDDAERTFNTDGKEYVFPRMWSDKFEQVFGAPRQRGTELTQRDKDIACSLQRQFERVYMELIRDAVALTGCRDAVMAGGCVLNGVGNGKVLQEGLLDRIYMHPAAGDDGTAAGAASYVMHAKLGVPRTAEVTHAYWGTGWNEDQIAQAVAASGFAFRKLSEEELLKTVVDAFCQGKIVGWFQGREEWGPRALGNRSILAHPGWPDMKGILNARIKNREAFRPFAPAILEEKLSTCFEGNHTVPFMNIVYKIRPEWRQKLAAVNHEDDTGRVQTVRRDQNRLYYDLIKTFEARTGTPVILNTSFNENEPIVHTPKHAIDCFARTKMDCLALGPFWYEKPADLAAQAQVITSGY
jgi:carbamoyltransferase